MKLLKFDEFAKMPEGTVFSFWKPCVSDGLNVKYEMIRWASVLEDPESDKDFFYAPLTPEPSAEDTFTPEFPRYKYRWGMFDYDQLFAVYEIADLKQLSISIKDAILLVDEPGNSEQIPPPRP